MAGYNYCRYRFYGCGYQEVDVVRMYIYVLLVGVVRKYI